MGVTRAMPKRRYDSRQRLRETFACVPERFPHLSRQRRPYRLKETVTPTKT